MLLTLAIFCLSALAIYLSCEFFVNGVEWCGSHLKLGSMAVGAVLAAFGTALPESSVTFIAVVFGRTPAEKDLGVGAALGGPLVLSTLAYTVVGVALLANWKRLNRTSQAVEVDRRMLSRDQGIFLLLFVVNIALGLTNFPAKHLCGLLFIAAYGVYVLVKMRASSAGAELEELEPEPLKIRPSSPTLFWAVVQTLAALVVIAVASRFFVLQLGAIGMAFHLPAQLTALLLSPVATELPETINALIWVRQGKERLALANISGAMMIQATIPSALGLLFTPWHFSNALLYSATATLAAILLLWTLFRRGRVDARALLPVALFYCAFAAAAGNDFLHRWDHVPAADHQRQNPLPATEDVLASGESAYREHCIGCHHEHAVGDTHGHPALSGKLLARTTDGDLEWFLRQGSASAGMPAWGGLSEADRWSILRYLRSLK